jgi:hypothetical protein
MGTCSRCGMDTHRDFPDKAERCSGCDRTASWCRCAPVQAARKPLWLERANQKRNGLARDESGAAA